MRARLALLSMTAAILAGVPSADAAQVQVSIQDFEYQPEVITVQAGDTVTWTNLDGANHTVTSDTGLFDSGNLGNGATFSRTFTQPGSFTYFCRPHASFMRGEVRVEGEGTAPAEAPNNFDVRPGGAIGSIQLSWTPPVLDGGSPATSYRVCRSETEQGPQTCWLVNTTSYLDQNQPLLATRWYRVSSINFFGEGPATGARCSKPFPWSSELGCGPI